MKRAAFALSCAALCAVASAEISCKLTNGDVAHGGACFVSENSSPVALKEEQRDFAEKRDVKEWHIHVYFFQTNPDSVAAANRLREGVIEQVVKKNFVVITHGVTNAMTAPRRFNESNVPFFNMAPIGPHPCGSFEIWVPKEYFAQAVSYVSLHRGQLSILVHPLTYHEVEDHSARAMWIGSPYRLDFTALSEHGYDSASTDLGEYPELGLGYSADPHA